MERENGKRGELFKTPSSPPSIDRSNERASPPVSIFPPENNGGRDNNDDTRQ